MLRGPLMEHEYDLFELWPDGSSLWRDSAFGFQLTRRRLQAFVLISNNQFYAIDLTTGEILDFISERATHMDSARFQKLNDEARAMLLRYGRDGGRIQGDRDESNKVLST